MNSLGFPQAFHIPHSLALRMLYQACERFATPNASLASTPGTPRENEKLMNNATILVVDDEPQIRRVLRATLSSNGYDVIEAKNGQEAIEIAVREHPDLILLDVNMPEMSGLEACSKMRLSFSTPIIMVTVRNSEQDKVLALDSGADDYVVKPFAIGELLARIRAALRRSSSGDPLPKIETSELSIDLEKRSVDVRGARVHLTPKEFDVLRALVVQEGKPLTHKRLLQTVWGPDHAEETENLRVVINQLRKKIERDPAHPRYILTEPWLGYRFQLPSPASEKRSHRKS
jgi:two-component system KDP operon response regulator KdpE